MTAITRNALALLIAIGSGMAGPLLFGGFGTSLVLTAIGTLLAILVAHPGTGKNLALSLFSVVICISVCEFALRLQKSAEDVATIWGRNRVQTFSAQVFAPNPELGFDAIPNVTAKVTSRHNDHLVYDVTYSFDSHGARVTPGDRTGEPVIVAGDSFNFGEGLNDNQTLAYHLSNESHGEVYAINVARPGYGLHQVLRQLELDVPAQNGVTGFHWIFVSFVDNHLERVNGRYSWMRGSPRYEVDGAGVVRRVGVFGDEHGSPWANNLGQYSRLADAVQRIWQHFVADDDARRFTAVVHAIEETAERKYHAKAVFIYHAGASFLNDRVGRRELMHQLLEAAHVDYVDVNERLPQLDDSYFIADDGHPSEKLNVALARHLLPRVYAAH